MTNTTIDAASVRNLFNACLFQEDEPTDGAVQARGVNLAVGFHPARLAEAKGQIGALLQALPDTFHTSGGGGGSFLNACMGRAGNHWGEHRNVQELLLLGLASGQARYCLSREMWGLLPGGMPYFQVDG